MNAVQEAIARIRSGSGYQRDTQRARDIRTLVNALDTASLHDRMNAAPAGATLTGNGRTYVKRGEYWYRRYDDNFLGNTGYDSEDFAPGQYTLGEVVTLYARKLEETK